MVQNNFQDPVTPLWSSFAARVQMSQLFWRKTFPLPCYLLLENRPQLRSSSQNKRSSFVFFVSVWDSPNWSYNKPGWPIRHPKIGKNYSPCWKTKPKTEGEHSSVLQSGCLQCKGTVVILQTLLVKACPASIDIHPAPVSLRQGRLCWSLCAQTQAGHSVALLAQFSVRVSTFPPWGDWRSLRAGAPHRHGSQVQGPRWVRRRGTVPAAAAAAAGVWGKRWGGGVSVPLRSRLRLILYGALKVRICLLLFFLLFLQS